MDVYLLGAGRPASGRRPAALKNIALNTTALDWQLHSFEVISGARIHFLGGYHVEEVIDAYPQLSYTVIPDWEQHTVLHTLLQAPFTNGAAMLAYADTIFRRSSVEQVWRHQADVVFAVDLAWQQRYQSRSQADLEIAETIELESFSGDGTAEFTGLVKLSEEVVTNLRDVDESAIGTSLPDLVDYLRARGFSTQIVDVSGHWAEFNSPADIAHFILGTKAETLARLEPLVRRSHIGKQVTFDAATWHENTRAVIEQIQQNFPGAPLIVRSSARGEDNWESSNAGGFESCLNVDGADPSALQEAIESVIGSYGNDAKTGSDQVLVQEFVRDVKMSGVVFTCGLETGAPYYRINFDDKNRSTESVTAGTHLGLRTVLVNRQHRQYLKTVAAELMPVLDAVSELEALLGFDKLDIEFAVDDDDRVHVFQVRPITVDHSRYEVSDRVVERDIETAIRRFRDLQSPSPFILGDRAYFGNMPDWNPAEIIGTRPKPLAFSLYRYLITDDVWACQRAEYGYRDVRPSPLILAFCGQPYVDIRASLNSFIPAELPEKLASRLAKAYLSILANHPEYHDKIEFDVAFTVWTPTFVDNARHRLGRYDFSDADIEQLGAALKLITRRAIIRLQDDVRPLAQMNERRRLLVESGVDSLDLAYALLDDCRRYGTLAFSHAARAGFVATTLLNSMVEADILTEHRRQAFMHNIRTVASEFEEDKKAHRDGMKTLDQLVEKYGHLRPGTYDLASQAYWEDPQLYLSSDATGPTAKAPVFQFTEQESAGMQSLLDELGSDADVEKLQEYLSEAIRLRESVKFEFTRNLSLALDACIRYGGQQGLSREQVVYLEYADLERLKVNTIDIETLKKYIDDRMQRYAVTELIELPHLIINESDFYCFERRASMPNFVTTGRVIAPVADASDSDRAGLKDKIVMIPQADPGYDWLFGCGIAGLITRYGGANSHMAIRAAEMAIPAAIGVGDKLYEAISNMQSIDLDCGNHVIREVQ